MMRARFKANADDPRPIKFPPPYPYWVTGYGDDYAVIVAYADTTTQIEDFWPEARDISFDLCSEIVFTDRFPKPDWWRSTPTPS